MPVLRGSAPNFFGKNLICSAFEVFENEPNPVSVLGKKFDFALPPFLWIEDAESRGKIEVVRLQGRVAVFQSSRLVCFAVFHKR